MNHNSTLLPGAPHYPGRLIGNIRLPQGRELGQEEKKDGEIHQPRGHANKLYRSKVSILLVQETNEGNPGANLLARSFANAKKNKFNPKSIDL
jgi:hypothetical protein